MKGWQLYIGIRLGLVISLSGFLGIVSIQPGLAEKSGNEENKSKSIYVTSPTPQQQRDFKIPQLSELEIPITSAQRLLVQSPTPQTTPAPAIIQITGVKANPTNEGVEVILETTQGTQLQVTNRSVGNNFIADVPGAQLRLPSGEAFIFRSSKPIAGITEIVVNNIDANTVRVTVVGEKALPTVELFDDNVGLVFEVTSAEVATQPPQTPSAEEQPTSEVPTQEETAAQPDEPIELVVTGEQDGYNVPNASTATRTDTPIRDIPQSIQVVPQQVLEDRNVRTVTEALETVSGVASGARIYGGAPITFKIIRGFDQAGSGTVNFRNGLPDGDFYTLTPIGTIERVEVLKGPASVLFGAGEPGGIVNTVTKQPLSEPYYRLGFEAGNYGFYQPSIDLSGPLDTDKKVLYRFIASYQGSSDFQGFSDTRLTTIAPSITFKLGDRTNLDLYYEYTHLFADPAAGLSTAVFLSDGSLTPRNFATYYPSLQSVDATSQKFGYILNHKFSDRWQIRNNVAVSLTSFAEDGATGFTLTDDRFLEGFDVSRAQYQRNNYFGQIDLLGKFNTGSISHQVLAGFDFNRFSNVGDRINADTPLPPLDIRNPNYNISTPTFSTRSTFSDFDFVRRSYGVYLQDQIAFSDNLKLLIGGRYDWISTDFEADVNIGGDVVVFPTQNDGAFSPRVGLVYQPSEEVSLYASYTRSFYPISGFDNVNPDVKFDPTRGTQYEIGVKTDFLDGRLSATLAAYQLTKTKVLTTVVTSDPINPVRSIQTGEQRSRGIELDVTGEILPGWKVTAAYAYTNAEITEDETFPVGNRLANVPENQASLWTTYEIQKGDLKGLGFGLGLFYVGARQGDLDNSFELDDYFRTDAALYYRRDGFNAAINVRNVFDINAAAFAYSRTYVQRTEPFTIIGSISWEF
ncbi:TonB-dependent siderophore receptor [Chlorogloeopsis sp. ULAP02]|uniref:TonB-dependent siderophore receptor n=1 Tax=Chlorogloeopsis sp. ULAP02 TaxID=3107926 RepID=UPI003135270F